MCNTRSFSAEWLGSFRFLFEWRKRERKQFSHFLSQWPWPLTFCPQKFSDSYSYHQRLCYYQQIEGLGRTNVQTDRRTVDNAITNSQQRGPWNDCRVWRQRRGGTCEAWLPVYRGRMMLRLVRDHDRSTISADVLARWKSTWESTEGCRYLSSGPRRAAEGPLEGCTSQVWGTPSMWCWFYGPEWRWESTDSGATQAGVEGIRQGDRLIRRSGVSPYRRRLGNHPRTTLHIINTA